MELKELLKNIKPVSVEGDIAGKSISGIFYDSRNVKKNSIFVAIKGYKTDGHNFIGDAINRGASVVILEDGNALINDLAVKHNTVKVLVSDSRKALAELSHYYYGEPTKKIKLIGVTGTNGKTTTTFFIKSILETAGFKTGLIGTIKNLIGDKEISSSLTTPESSDLNFLFSEMLTQGCNHAVMEVSSHSLILNRVYKLHFSEGIFTNLTQEHLDFHGTLENYLNAKKMLFDSLDCNAYAIYNLDDDFGNRAVSDSNAKIFSYGISSASDFRLKDIQFDLDGTSFSILFQHKEYKLTTLLVGDFNAYNACSAFAAGMLLGIDEEVLITGVANTKQVPGRFEVISSGNKKIIIDYSHTPDSLQKALLAIRKIVKDTKPVYAVFGCGGNRDRTKRPVMGKIASEIADSVVITSDNPRYEEPMAIIEEIKSGISKKNFTLIENREEAIRKTIKNSEDDAVILIAGKGHETYQEIKGVRTHFSDRETAEKYLNE